MAESQNNLIQYFKTLLDTSSFEDYAPNGLQIEGKKTIKRLAFAVSATQDSLTKALEWGADGLVVHHGIFWKHQGARTITGAWGERVKLAVKNELNLFAYHLPLDAHAEVGNAVALAQELNLVNLAPFALYKRQYLGTKGEFTHSVTALELKISLEQILKHPVILATPNGTDNIKSVGIITGGANNEWFRAMEDGLDAYITGEISEYNWHDSIEAGVHYFAGGHHATERFGTVALMKKVQKDFPNLQTMFFDSDNLA